MNLPMATDLWMALDGAPASGGFTSGLIPIALILFILYLFIIRPQQKEQREHAELVASLAKDDLVVTNSGLHGQVYEVRENSVIIEIADKVRVEFDKAAVARKG